MNKIYRILGKKGRITIPFEIRMRQRFSSNDVISFEEKVDHTIIIRREKICDHCKIGAVEKETALFDVINSLKPSEQKAVFKYLARKLADSEDL